MTLPVLTYGLAAVLYLMTSAVLLVAWRQAAAARLTMAAVAITAVWAAVLAFDARGHALPLVVPEALEALRYAAWFTALRAFASRPLPRLFERGVLLLPAVLLAAALLVSASQRFALTVIGGLLLALAGLVLAEQVYRNATPARRGTARLIVIGTGIQFAYDLFLYSQAQLLDGVSAAAWSVRAIVCILVLPTLVLAVRRVGDAGPVVFVSRHVVFYTSSMLAVGAYLCAMAVGGYYVREHGGRWGDALQLIFLFGAGVVLVTLLLSETLWRRLKVFIATHFYRNKYDYRVEWLRFIQTLSTNGREDPVRAAIQAVAQIFRCPSGVLFMREDDGRRFSRTASWPEPDDAFAATSVIGADEELPVFLEQRRWVIDTDEYAAAPSVYRNISLPEWLQAERRRIVVPLLHAESLLGFMVMDAPPAPFRMTFEDRDLFKTVGSHVALLLAQQRADDKLAENRQFAAFNRLGAFVMHDLKNSVAQLQLLVSNAAKHRDNPEFIDDAVSTISNTVERMTRLIGQLQTRDARTPLRELALDPLAAAAVVRGAARTPTPQFESGMDGDSVLADPEQLAAVIDHVIRNAQEAAGSTGRVVVRLRAEGPHAIIEVEDDGPGMESAFVRDRLFRPFDSTKGSKGMGIGAYQAREYVRQLGGDVEVLSSPGQGTRFCIRLPLCQTKNPES